MESKKTPLSIGRNKLYYSRNGRYYNHNGENYTKTFPIEWAQNYIAGTGPKECRLCREWGSWNGVFVGYCHKCAFAYDNKRGYGFWGIHNGESIYPDNPPGSATNTYMCNVKLRDVGDKNIVDSASLFLVDHSIMTSAITLNEIAEQNKKYFDKMIRDFESSHRIHSCLWA